MFTGTVGGIYHISNWIMRLAYVNFLWILFTLAGFIVFGFFPATIATFAVVRKWIFDTTDIPIFTTFWNTYKQALVKGNGFGLILFSIGAILYIDFIFLRDITSGFLQYMYYPLLLMILLCALTVIYIFPVYVHYQMTFFQVLKNAFFIMIINPPITVTMIFSIVIIFYIFHFIPSLILLCGVSGFAYIITWAAQITFTKIHKLAEAQFKEI